jgi:cobalt-zinc-cadmium efflux system outer membrane protein
MRGRASCRRSGGLSATLLGGLVWTGLVTLPLGADPPAPGPEAPPPVLSLDAAVRWALQNNPEIAALRQQHGIAAAAVVIARTYPFNPLWETKLRAANGPESAGITNRVNLEQILLLETEIRGQGQHRRRAAGAALSRTDWEITFQEVSLGVRVVRGFNTMLYRQQKLRLAEQTVSLNDRATEQVRKLVEQAKLRPADLLVIRTEVEDARAQLGPARAALTVAWHDLRRALGVVDEVFDLQGTLGAPLAPADTASLVQAALERRADLRAHQAAVAEAEARLRLTVADRYGNPAVGPNYEYDPTRINLIGVQLSVPLPVLNTHKGDILQRQAERDRAQLEVRQFEVQVRQDVLAALARLEAARAVVEHYQMQTLPNLRSSLEGIERLFAEGDPGVDVLRVLDIRRKLLRAMDVYIDALWELSQAQADLMAAVGDPALLLGAGCVPNAEKVDQK